MLSTSHLDGLNEPQRQAVTTTEGPLLVLAGAGSGKTRVITHRIVHLILSGRAPERLLAVTFTNKAAAEMRERVMHLIQAQVELAGRIDSYPTVTTFHSLGVRILREFHEAVGLRRHFTIYDRSDTLRAVKEAITRANYNPKEFEPRKILSRISRAKGDGVTVTGFRESASTYPDQVAGEVWLKYEEILQEEGALDFDDLLVKTLRLLENNPVVLKHLQARFQYIHIDEYQDTNHVQFLIAKLLAGVTCNICAVGDIDQNIYSWRGANIQNVLQFEREFPGARTILLEENYRSTKTIIGASNDVIEKNRQRVEKNVFTNNAVGEPIELFAAMTGLDEAAYIADTARELIRDGVAPSEIAVLYRTNFQSRVLEEAFLTASIPYQLLGTKFFERKEIKDVLAYLRLAMNRNSAGDLARIINEPARGIGKVSLLKVLEGKRGELNRPALAKIEAFDQMIEDIENEARTKPISETIKFILHRSGMEAHYKREGTEEDLSRLENVRELVTLARRFDELDPEAGVEAFIENAALQSDQDELQNKEERDAVRLMTVHAAKGLEFPYVFIVGLEEGLFPHERLDDTGIDHEEERRLFYVAITRAGKRLFLSYAHIRTIYGSQRVNVPSSFLNDIKPERVKVKRDRDDWGDGGFASGYETTVYLD